MWLVPSSFGPGSVGLFSLTPLNKLIHINIYLRGSRNIGLCLFILIFVFMGFYWESCFVLKERERKNEVDGEGGREDLGEIGGRRKI